MMRVVRQLFLVKRKTTQRYYLSYEGRHIPEARFAKRYSALHTSPEARLIPEWLAQDVDSVGLQRYGTTSDLKIASKYDKMFMGIRALVSEH